MDTSTLVLVSAVLLVATALLIVSHVRSWRAFQQQDLDDEEFDYRRRQFRRRMQTSAMLGLLAIALPIGYALTVWSRSGWFLLVFWTAIMAIACWIALLAVVDMIATRHHFGRLRHQCLVEQAKLESEIRRIQAVQGNGKAGKLHHGEKLTDDG